MSTFVFASGVIDGEVTVRQVGDEKTPVANFRINAQPGWFTIACWRDLAAKVEHLAVGTPIHLTGKLSTRSYENKDGIKVYVTEIVASSVELISASEAPAAPTGNPGPAAMVAGNPVDDAALFGD